MDKKKGNAVRIIQNVLIAVLFASMLVLSSACFILMTSSAKTAGTDEPFDFSQIGGHSDASSVGYGTTVLSPAVIAVSAGDERYAAYGGDAADTVYRLAVQDVRAVLTSSNAELKAADEAEWASLSDAGRYVYFRFTSAVPIEAMLDYAGAGEGISEQNGSGCFVSEAFLRYDGGDALLMIRSPYGVYSANGKVSSVRFDGAVDAMRASGAVRFDMLADEGRTVLLSDGILKTPRCSVSIGVSALPGSKQSREELLTLFGMNPDKVRTNEHTTGVTFVDVSGTIVADTGIAYTAYGSGVPIGGVSSLTGYLRAADSFISAVSSAIGADLPKTRLDFLSSSDGALTLEYGYCFDGIPLVGKDGGGLGITMTLSENGIVAFDMDIVSATHSDGQCILPDGRIFYGAYSAERPDAILPVLVYDGGTAEAYSEWRALVPYGGGDVR